MNLGPLPLNECYFVGAEHEGIAAGPGCIVILHVPTGDIWNLSPLGPRSLGLARVINGQEVPARLATRLQALRSRAILNCGGVLNPTHPESDIVSTDVSRNTSGVLSQPIRQFVCVHSYAKTG